MIAFLADASPQIGMGHVYRCLSVARQIKKISGADVRFICASGKEQVIAAGFGVIERQGSVKSIDIDHIAGLIKSYNIDCLITDSYLPDCEYYIKIKQLTKSARVYDIGETDYPADIFIDYNLDYYKYNFTGAEEYLLGPKYAPLRSEFMNLGPKFISPEANNAVITAGGSDPIKITDRILTEVLEDDRFNGINFTVIAGKMNSDKANIERTARDHPYRVKLIVNADNMAEIFMNADIALTSCGSTLCELCACGTPTIAFSIAENQDSILNAAEELGIAESAGILWRGANLDKMKECLNLLVRDRALRQSLSEKMRREVDGQGALRIAQCVIDK